MGPLAVRGGDICSECDDFPCATLAPLMASREAMLVQCHPRTHLLPEEEDNLTMRQFDSMGHLVAGLVRAGKLLPWCMRGVAQPTAPAPERTRE